MRFRLVIIFFLLAVTAGQAMAGTVTLAGSGGMIPLLTELGNAYMKRHPSDIIRVNPNSLTQSGGIMAAKNGTVDIGMSARNLTEAEKNGDVETYLISKVAAEIAVHRSVTVKNITSQQICDIYAGKIGNWREVGGNDSEIVVLTKADTDSTKQTVREGIGCFRELKEGGPRLVKMQHSLEMSNALVTTPDAIGMIDGVVLGKTNGKARALAIDGRRSSPAAVAAGRWPLVKHYNLILGRRRSRTVDDFMRFISSPDGRAVIRRNGGVPVAFAYP